MSSLLRLIEDEEVEFAPPVETTEPKKGKERDAKALQNDFLYWKSRAENRELVGTYDNVQSCLLALRDVIKLTKEATVKDREGEKIDLFPEDAMKLLSRIRERASVTVRAIEEGA